MIPRIRLVQIKNYKSLEAVSVELEPFTVFVGPNGSGKSNFLDALAFVQECVSESVELALRTRGGAETVLGKYVDRLEFLNALLEKRSPEIPQKDHLGFRIQADLGEGQSADYAFEIRHLNWNYFEVARERCVVQNASREKTQFDVQNGKFVQSLPDISPVLLPDRLILPVLAGLPGLRPLWEFLVGMRTYAIRPESIREHQSPDRGFVLKPDGSNTASVLKYLSQWSNAYPKTLDTINRLLPHVTKGIAGVSYRQAETKETVSFQQHIGLENPIFFDALSMSDGTLRVLGLLLAVLQPLPKVVGIEEPEATVHPAIAEMIMEVLMDAAQEKQVLITTHSPDLLDQKELQDRQIRIVGLRNGRTVIAPMSEGDRQAIRERLYSPGELLRMGELNSDQDVVSQKAEEMDLFGEPFPHLAQGQ